jgi:F-type H+-transporting ATPase subunit b
MQIISNIALISINETLLVQLLSFLIFLFIINRMMFRPLQNVRSERANYMDKIKTDARNAAKELETLTDQLKAQESSVRTQAQGLKQEIEESGSMQAAEIIAAAREQIDTLKETAEAEVDAQIFEARKHIQKESETLAVNIMEKLLERRLAS